MNVNEKRQKIVEIAASWLGTPYHTMGRLKSVGCDCLTLLVEIYTEAGIIPEIDIPYYPHDWHLHNGTERYLNGLLAYSHEIATSPLSGDIVLWKFGRCYSHGAIVIEWPTIIHAYTGRACVLENAESANWLNYIGENGIESGKIRPKRFFSVFN
jgi:cell wall-associated NlpC family hydrolase